MKPTLKIDFIDFWVHFNKTDNYFYNLLSQEYNLEFSPDPDFIIYSGYGEKHLNYSCYRIFYNAENLRVNWNACDYAFSSDYVDDDRHYRLPNYILYDKPEKLMNSKHDPESILRVKTGFCNMVVSNPHSKKRIAFYHKLNKIKKVDSGGRHLNNIGGPIDNKREFIRKYKFTLAFENSAHPGYTTEKLFEPMLENSIPIYWGNPEVGRDFNTNSFLNYADFNSDEALIEKIIELDRNDNQYLAMLSQPWYLNNQMPATVNEHNVLRQFRRIFDTASNNRPVAQTPQRYLYRINLLWQKSEFYLNRVLKYRENFR
ncbi:MAG: glycosyltransferase [Chitinophagaceae bacterium]|nr:glycosyltransferase [Chitinophagaceae bacterium]